MKPSYIFEIFFVMSFFLIFAPKYQPDENEKVHTPCPAIAFRDKPCQRTNKTTYYG